MTEYFKKEPVLIISGILAVGSMFFVRPDSSYLGYIEFRTLGILFALMAIVAGMSRLGVFDMLADTLLGKMKNMKGITTVLVMICFFMSMFITNDVSLITFVPFTFAIMDKVHTPNKERDLISIVVMQTIAANLGCMLVPFGSPHNLYLFGETDMSFLAFTKLMLPYWGLSLVLLAAWIWIPAIIRKDNAPSNYVAKGGNTVDRKGLLFGYIVLFLLSLLVVCRVLNYLVLMALVIIYLLAFDRKVFRDVDYSLLITFVLLFIFIGNLGRIESFEQMLSKVIAGREIITAVVASQAMSNVPAAILLSGFTKNYEQLILGINFGGLGTLIASMASLISFKLFAQRGRALTGRYFRVFTIANVIFLAILMIASYVS